MEMTNADRILIVGASGMVGRSLRKSLTGDGYRNILAPSSAEMNALSAQSVNSYFASHRPQYVFHLAGRIGGIASNLKRPVEFLAENTMMAMTVIEAAKNHAVEKLLYVGSSCIYPRECRQPMKEEYLLSGPLEPTNEGYALAKISGLKLCEYMNQQFGTQFFTLIPCNIYGQHDHFEPENSHVISALIYKMHKAKLQNESSVEIWGRGNSRREFIFVDDFSAAMIYFMKSWTPQPDGNYINTGSGEDLSVRELAHLIREIVGFQGELVFNTSKPDGMPKKCTDNSRAAKLGWSAKTTLATGLRETYAWYQQSVRQG